MILAAEHLFPKLSSILLVIVAIALISCVIAYFARKVTSELRSVGEGYTELYRQQHREVMEALKGETRKALADTKALVMEHTELERILKALSERAEDNADDKATLDRVDQDGSPQ